MNSGISPLLMLLVAAGTLWGQDTSKHQAAEKSKHFSASNSKQTNEPSWKAKHKERMKIYQAAAKSLQNAIDQADKAQMSQSISATAAMLPVTSYLAKKLRQLAKAIPRADDDDKKAKSESLSVQEAKEQLVKISGQLEFQPKLEADMPNGFPAPTPVGEIEIKSYPGYRMARTKLDDAPMSGEGNSSFLRLFNHIQSNEIAMTAPVEMTYRQTDSGVSESTMAFLYKDPNIGRVDETGAVKVIDVEPKRVIAMGLRGRAVKERIEQAEKELRKHSATYASRFALSRDVRVLGYNGPSVPVEEQFFEVQLELLKRSSIR